MQDECAEMCSRLNRLQATSQKTWAEIAAQLQLSESMLYQARSGKRQLSQKALHRLALAERELGLASPAIADIGRVSARKSADVAEQLRAQARKLRETAAQLDEAARLLDTEI